MASTSQFPASSELESRWQSRWSDKECFKWTNNEALPKYYILEMFPYASGRLHIGHARNFTMGDVVARMKRAQGYDVLYPMGWDAFGLPAENAAIKIGIHPAESTANAIEAMKEGMVRLGLSYDWSCESDTSDANYIAAQQRLFLKFFEAGLVYRDTRFTNWCDNDQTVLADEQVVDGRCWRCDGEVTKRRVPQWFFDIRRYADQLIDDLDQLDGWRDRVRNIQRSWIGRKSGTEIQFELVGYDGKFITTFTTRVDTLMGCRFLLLAPEHESLDRIPLPADNAVDVEKFRQRILSQSRQERLELRVKEGVFTGLMARHPLEDWEIPVWVSNYVLSDYGSGAVMAVPAHDERDFEFAEKYGLPIDVVISPDGGPADLGETAYTEDGILINSGAFDGLTSAEARSRITERLVELHRGEAVTTFRLQNWSVSRQRYWGNPIPIIYCERDGVVPVPEKDLPILLPMDVDFINSSRGDSRERRVRQGVVPHLR